MLYGWRYLNSKIIFDLRPQAPEVFAFLVCHTSCEQH